MLDIYSEDKVKDIGLIWAACWDQFAKFGGDPGRHLEDARIPICRVVADMYNLPYYKDVKGASPFKRAAWFATCFLFHNPLTKPFNRNLTGKVGEHNALAAYNIALHFLDGNAIRWKGRDRSIPGMADELLSTHSFLDILEFLVDWSVIPQGQKSKIIILNFYRALSLLLEQVTYRAFPSLSYPPLLYSGDL
jgi:hypothetical protein